MTKIQKRLLQFLKKINQKRNHFKQKNKYFFNKRKKSVQMQFFGFFAFKHDFSLIETVLVFLIEVKKNLLEIFIFWLRQLFF